MKRKPKVKFIKPYIDNNVIVKYMTIDEIRAEFGDDVANEAAEVVKPYNTLREQPLIDILKAIK